MLAWSHARLCDEFLQWGYNLGSFVKKLPDNPRSARIVTRFAEEQIAEWMESGDWGGWAACHNQFLNSAKGLLCLCGGVRKLARADRVVTFLDNHELETCCDACGVRLDRGDDVEFCGRKKRLSEHELGTMISCHVFICNTCVASCFKGDKFERIWEEVPHTGGHGAKGKASWRPARPPRKYVPASEPNQPEGSASVSDQPETAGESKESLELSERDSPKEFPEEFLEELPEL